MIGPDVTDVPAPLSTRTGERGAARPDRGHVRHSARLFLDADLLQDSAERVGSAANVDDLVFIPHAREAMAADSIPEAGVYHVVGDADQILDYDNGLTEFVGTWEGRVLSVIIEYDGVTVVTVFEREKRRRRRRPG